MPRALPRSLLLLALPLLPMNALAQPAVATITGRVIDSETRLPLVGVTVQFPAAGQSAETDSLGVFSIGGMPPSLTTVRLSRPGYAPVQRNVNLPAGRTTRVEYVMVREGAPLPEITVVAKPEAVEGPAILAGFEERRAKGGGVFLDAKDLARYQARRMSDVLRGSTSLNMVNSGQAWYAASNRQARAIRNMKDKEWLYCYLDIILDGQIIWSQNAEQTSILALPIDGIVGVPELAAVEIYSSAASVPQKYRSITNTCGAIMFWTKRWAAEAHEPPG